MWPSVQAAFVPFTTTFEGKVPWMYVDQDNLVTTGIGNLIDPVSMALPLPWTHGVGGLAATPAEIQAAWTTVKNAGAAGTGGGNQGNLTDLRLSDDAIAQLVQSKIFNDEAVVSQYFPNWNGIYADAQLGILSMDWAMGPAFPAKFPKFLAAVNAGNWTDPVNGAAAQSWMRDSSAGVPTSLTDDLSQYPPDINAGLRPRNLANRQLFLNAGAQQAAGADPGQLIWNSGLALPGSVAIVGAAVSGHPILTAVGITLGVTAAIIMAQKAGLVRAVSPAADRQLVRLGRTMAAPFRAPATDIDRWIHHAIGRTV